MEQPVVDEEFNDPVGDDRVPFCLRCSQRANYDITKEQSGERAEAMTAAMEVLLHKVGATVSFLSGYLNNMDVKLGRIAEAAERQLDRDRGMRAAEADERDRAAELAALEAEAGG